MLNVWLSIVVVYESKMHPRSRTLRTSYLAYRTTEIGASHDHADEDQSVTKEEALYQELCAIRRDSRSQVRTNVLWCAFFARCECVLLSKVVHLHSSCMIRLTFLIR